MKLRAVAQLAVGCRNGAAGFCREHQMGDKVQAALVDIILAKVFEALVPVLPHGLVAFIAGSLFAGLGN